MKLLSLAFRSKIFSSLQIVIYLFFILKPCFILFFIIEIFHPLFLELLEISHFLCFIIRVPILLSIIYILLYCFHSMLETLQLSMRCCKFLNFVKGRNFFQLRLTPHFHSLQSIGLPFFNVHLFFHSIFFILKFFLEGFILFYNFLYVLGHESLMFFRKFLLLNVLLILSIY